MKNRKFLIAMLSACLLASCTMGVACNFEWPFGKKEESSPTESTSDTAPESSSAGSLEEGVEVALDKTSLELEKYDKAKLTAVVYGSTAAVTWSSSDSAVATVDNEGNIKAVSVGTATITAAADGVEATCEIVVKKTSTAPVIKLDAEEIYLNLNGSFTSEVKALWKGEEVEEEASYSWVVVEGQATDVATATMEGDEVTFTALKAGTTVFRVATDIRGIHVSKDVSITVYGQDLSIVATNSAFVPEAGYYALNLATADIAGHKASEQFSFVVYENGVEVKDAVIEWTIEDESIAALNGEEITTKKAGETKFIGTYTSGDVTATVTVHVNVVKPVISLEEPVKSVLEVQNLNTITIQTELLGTVESVTLHGREVLASKNGQVLSFSKEKMPTLAKELGEQKMLIATDLVVYELPVTLYTMIINNKEEMDSLVQISLENAGSEVGVWDGYFVLGNDIDYNGEFIPMTSHNQLYGALKQAGKDLSLRYNPAVCGFRGVFDGMGYNIDGLAIGVDKTATAEAEAGIFGVIHQNGIVRNVSFTNATMRENSGYIAAAGGGLIENISISYKQIGVGADQKLFAEGTEPRIMSSFYSCRQGVSDTALVRNCFVDASNAKFIWDEEANKRYKWPSLQLVGKAVVMENVILVCPNETVLNNAGANHSFVSYEALASNEYAQIEFDLWDKSFWTSLNGIPFTVNIAKNIDVEAEISLNAPDMVFVDKATEISVNGQYTKLAFAEEYAGVTLENGILIVTEEALGSTITLVLTSYLNDQIVEKDIVVKQLVNVTLEQEEAVFVESTDTTLDISFASAYNGETAIVYVGTTVVGEGAIVDGKIPVDASLIAAAGYGETKVQVMSEKDGAYNFYDLKVFYVTKVLKTVEDFKSISVQGGDRVNDTTITGYYILGNDIDCAGATISSNRAISWNSEKVGFRGVFDGNGKTISNAKIGECGLFGQVGEGAVIKDVTFDNITYTAPKYQRTALFGNLVMKATIQNITVNISSYAIACDNANVPSVEQGLFAGRYFIGNVVENVTFNVPGVEVYRIISRVSYNNTYNNVKIYAKSYMTIGDSNDQWAKIEELPEGMEFIEA